METYENLVNLTPHDVNIVIDWPVKKTVNIHTSGKVARVVNTNELVGSFMTVNMLGERLEIPVVKKTPNKVIDLPDPKFETIFIVSRIVKNAIPDREDVMVPDDLLRDESGNITGCRRLAL